MDTAQEKGINFASPPRCEKLQTTAPPVPVNSSDRCINEQCISELVIMVRDQQKEVLKLHSKLYEQKQNNKCQCVLKSVSAININSC